MRISPRSSRLLFAFSLLTAVSVAGVLAFGPSARSQTVEPEARPTPDYGRLSVSPSNLSFALLNYNSKKGRPAAESKTLTIENTGRASNTLLVNVGSITGPGSTSFSISPSPGLYQIVPGKAAAQPFIVTYAPITDGRVTAQIMISTSDASGQRGVTGRIVTLVGNARGPIPTPSITPTPTAIPTPTPFATGTPTPLATGTPTPTPLVTGTPTATPLRTGTPT